MKGNQKTRVVNDITAAHIRILYWFFAYPDKDFTFNGICEVTNTSKTTARAIIDDLCRNKWIRKTVLGRLWRLAANRETLEFRHAKIAHNLENVYATGIDKTVLNLYPQARAIILFGSFRKGDDASESDLDIAVEVPGTEELQIKPIGEIAMLGYRKNVKVNLHVFSRKKVDLNVFSNIANGIILHGFLEVRP